MVDFLCGKIIPPLTKVRGGGGGWRGGRGGGGGGGGGFLFLWGKTTDVPSRAEIMEIRRALGERKYTSSLKLKGKEKVVGAL